MSTSNDPTRIETGDLLIEKNADGNIEIHNLDDGSSVELGGGEVLADAISSGSVDTDELNNVLWATSPDEIDTLLDELPSQGGTVNLLPGQYGDTDWTQTITIPTDGTFNANYAINMAGSDIALSSFGGPYIQRPDGGSRATVRIHGPSRFDVDSVSDPGTVMELWHTVAERVYWPHTFGPVDSVITVRSNGASGHWGRFHVMGIGCQKGIVIGDTADSQTKDRAIWTGQLGNIRDIGVHVKYGQAHHFWVQPEQGHPDYDGTSDHATGYRVEYGSNTIYNWHNGDDINPLDITAPYVTLNPLGRLRIVGQDVHKVNVAVPPRRIFGGQGRNRIETFQGDISVNHDTTATNDATVSKHRHGYANLSPGTSAGDLSRFRATSGVGRGETEVLSAFDFHPVSTTPNARYRIGLTELGTPTWDGQALYLEADESDGTVPNWYFVVQDSSGAVLSSTDTGIPLSSENLQEMQINMSQGDHQVAYLNYELAAEAQHSLSQWNSHSLSPTAEVYPNGSGASNLEVWQYETRYSSQERFSLANGGLN